jgi:membrane dipeptidase
MVNFLPAFLDARNRKEENERSAKLKPQVDVLREQFKGDPVAFNEAERKLLAQHPVYVPTYARIVDHIDHIKNVVGIDYVGLGSDYDGIGGLPEGMSGAEDTAVVTYEMLRRGYSEGDIRKVLGLNFLRAFEQAEKVAANRQISGQGSLVKLK